MTIKKQVELLQELLLLMVEDIRTWEPSENGHRIDEIVEQLRNAKEEAKDE